MVNERQPPRASLRHSMLEKKVELNEDGMPISLLKIKSMEQLVYWMEKDLNAVLLGLADVEQNLAETTAEYQKK